MRKIGCSVVPQQEYCVWAGAEVNPSHPHETTINCLFWKLLSHHTASLSSLFTLVAEKQWPHSTDPWLPLHNTRASQQARVQYEPLVQGFVWKYFTLTVLHLACIVVGIKGKNRYLWMGSSFAQQNVAGWLLIYPLVTGHSRKLSSCLCLKWKDGSQIYQTFATGRQYKSHGKDKQNVNHLPNGLYISIKCLTFSASKKR